MAWRWWRIVSRCVLALLGALCIAPVAGWATAPTEAELAEAARWAAAKFKATADSPKPLASLLVHANHGPVQPNARGGKPMRLATNPQPRPLLPRHEQGGRQPARRGREFTALAGVDSNEQTSGGRGSVDFSVQVAGRKFRSGVLREGMAGQAGKVDLGGATEFVLQIDETPDGIACDQADWAEAKVSSRTAAKCGWPTCRCAKGARRALRTEPPFSFDYGGKASAELLKTWQWSGPARELDDRRTEHTLGLDRSRRRACRCAAWRSSIAISRPWSGRSISRTPARTTRRSCRTSRPSISALDAARAGEFVLHHHTGDNCTPDSYEPRPADPGAEIGAPLCARRRAAHQRGFPYFNIEWPGRRAHRRRSAGRANGRRSSPRDAGEGLRIRGGQELTRFKLQPGEEVRTPLVVLQFWTGDRVRAQNVWRRWMLAHNLPRPGDGKLPPPILSSCSGGFFPGI